LSTTGGATHFIKYRERGARPGDPRWFLTPRGVGNRLRIHAARFTAEDAERHAARLNEENPGLEFFTIPIPRSPTRR
jgi:hypothetical protein